MSVRVSASAVSWWYFRPNSPMKSHSFQYFSRTHTRICFCFYFYFIIFFCFYFYFFLFLFYLDRAIVDGTGSISSLYSCLAWRARERESVMGYGCMIQFDLGAKPSGYQGRRRSWRNFTLISIHFWGIPLTIFIIFPILYSHNLTRGHSLILSKPKVRLNVSKFSFYSRVVDPWNLLPDRVVSAGTLPTFKFLLKTLHLLANLFFIFLLTLTVTCLKILCFFTIFINLSFWDWMLAAQSPFQLPLVPCRHCPNFYTFFPIYMHFFNLW